MENQLVAGKPTKVVEGGTPADGDLLKYSASGGKRVAVAVSGLTVSNSVVSATNITATTVKTALEELEARIAALE